LLGDDSSSDTDDEQAEIQMKFKDFKKKLKRGHIASLDDVILEGSTAMPTGFEDVMDEGNDTPYEDSSDEEDESMDEFDNDGHLVSKENNCVRFKKTSSGTPHFALGMKFRSKKQFKKAIIRYGLAERKVINIIKDEAKRVREKSDWHVCPWVCLLSNNTRTEVGR
jgi:alpha-galactosidase